MKKLCFYYDSIYSLGGIQRVITLLANEFYNKYDVTILCNVNIKREERIDYGINSKIRVITIENKFEKFIQKSFNCLNGKLKLFKKNSKMYSFFNYKLNFFERKKIAYFLKLENFDYILVEGMEKCCYFLPIIPKINSKIVSCWHHCYDVYINNYPYKYILKVLNSFNQTVVLCKNDADLIEKNFNKKVKYIYNPIVKKKYEKSKLTEKNFIAIGRYDYIKRHDRVIEAFNLFHQKNKEWKLKIIGDGPEKENLQKKINDLNLNDCVSLTGKTSNISEYYLHASCLLMGSSAEGLPMVILEAMQYGLPIIAYDLPVLKEINSQKIITVNQNDINNFEKEMEEIAKSFEKRKKIVANYEEEMGKFYIENIAEKWYKIL